MSQGTKIKLTDFDRSPRLAEIRAVYKSRSKMSQRAKIRESVHVADYLRSVWNHDIIELVEEFIVVCLSGSHQVNGWVKIASGGITSAHVDVRLIFAIALQTASTAIILAHNHPSGSLEPSTEDKALTRRIQDIGELLRIKVLDHIIITRESYYSFVDNGCMPT